MTRARAIALALALIASCASAGAAEPQGHANMLVGWKWLDADTWGDLRHQDAFGASLSIAGRGWPVHIALDVLRSEKRLALDESRYGPSGVQTLEGSSLEVAAGVRKFFDAGSTHPFIGCGLAWVSSRYDEERSSGARTRDNSNYGAWVQGGVLWRLGRRFELGLDLRWTAASKENPDRSYMPARAVDYGFGADTLELGGVLGGVTLGFGW